MTRCMYPLLLPLFLLIAGAVLNSCSKSDDQRRFEQQAFTEPSGITRTTGNGTIESTDPGDWNISPMYRQLVKVSMPAYPNPAPFNSYFTLHIDLNVPDAVSEMAIYCFRYPDELHGPIDVWDASRISSFNILQLDSKSVAASGSGAPGIYRILAFDQRENLITWGDVKIE